MTVIEVISPVSTASLPAAVGKTLYLPRPLSSARTLLGHPPVDVEHRRAVGERRHADVADVVRQERPAAGQRIAAAARHRRPRGARRAASHDVGAHGDIMSTTMLTSLPLTTTTFFTVLPSRYFATCGSASASFCSSSSEVPAGTVSRDADLAVHLHRHDDLLGARDRFVVGRPAGRNHAAGMPEPLPELLGHVRRERRDHQDQRLDRFLHHRDGFRTHGAADRVRHRRHRGRSSSSRGGRRTRRAR